MATTIEPIGSKHGAYIQEVVSDPEMAKTSDIPYPLPPEAADAWIERMKAYRMHGQTSIQMRDCPGDDRKNAIRPRVGHS